MGFLGRKNKGDNIAFFGNTRGAKETSLFFYGNSFE